MLEANTRPFVPRLHRAVDNRPAADVAQAHTDLRAAAPDFQVLVIHHLKELAVHLEDDALF